MSLTLYYHPISQPSRAVLALLGIGNIKYEGKVLELFKGETRTPQYLELNPFGGVPFITHDKLHLAESNAILTHICEAYPNELKGYYGADSDERALINQYLSWYQGTFRPVLIRPLRLRFEGKSKGKPVSKAAIAEAEAKIKDTLSFLQKRLSTGSPYLVGNHLSIADLLIFCQGTNLEAYKFDLTSWPHYNAWYNKVLENPVVGAIHTKFREGLAGFGAMFADLEYTE